MNIVQEATDLLLHFVKTIDEETGKQRSGNISESLLPSEVLYSALALISVHGLACQHMLEQLHSAPPDSTVRGLAAEQAVDWLEGRATRCIVSVPEGPAVDGVQVHSMRLCEDRKDRPS